jgi:hypothetical protein
MARLTQEPRLLLSAVSVGSWGGAISVGASAGASWLATRSLNEKAPASTIGMDQVVAKISVSNDPNGTTCVFRPDAALAGMPHPTAITRCSLAPRAA